MRPSIAPLALGPRGKLFVWKPAFDALAPVANRKRPYGTKTTSSNNFQAARKNTRTPWEIFQRNLGTPYRLIEKKSSAAGCHAG